MMLDAENEEKARYAGDPNVEVRERTLMAAMFVGDLRCTSVAGSHAPLSIFMSSLSRTMCVVYSDTTKPSLCDSWPTAVGTP